MPKPLTAWHYDGVTALRRTVTVAMEGSDLLLAETGERVPLASLRPMGDRRAAVFARAGGDGWRLGFAEPPPSDWAARLPGQEHHGGLLDRIGVVPALIAGAVLAAIAVVALMQGTSLIARLVPESWELGFGDALTGDFSGNACRGVAGQRALDGLASRLTGDHRPVRVRVVDFPVINAVTLPGRQVVLFRGLLGAAGSPDEVAGVLAHEIGHVENRDAMTALLRDFGISLLIGGADGGKIARALLSSRYSRAAERGADAYAIAALAQADVSPADTAGFFDRLARSERFGRAGAAILYFSTHPLSDERRRAFLDSAREAPPYRPALSAADWAALRGICADVGTAPPPRR